MLPEMLSGSLSAAGDAAAAAAAAAGHPAAWRQSLLQLLVDSAAAAWLLRGADPGCPYTAAAPVAAGISCPEACRQSAPVKNNMH